MKMIEEVMMYFIGELSKICVGLPNYGQQSVSSIAYLIGAY